LGKFHIKQIGVVKMYSNLFDDFDLDIQKVASGSPALPQGEAWPKLYTFSRAFTMFLV